MPAKIKFTDEQVRDIVTRYQGGETTVDLSKRFGYAHAIIGRLLHVNGVVLQKSRQKDFSKDLINSVCNDYSQNKLSIKKLSLKYSITEQRIRGIIYRAHQKMHSNQVYRKYTFNESYFEKIDTEEKAYWLGFLVADGSVRCASNSGCITTTVLSLGLSVVDKKHVEKFAKALEANNPIYTVNKAAIITLRSEKICSDLKVLGIVQNKTGKCYKPEISEELERHFWRGVCDGDGHLYLHGGKYPRVGLLGNEELMNSFVLFCRKNNIFGGCISKVKAIKAFNMLDVRFVGRSGKQALDLLYKNSNIYLDRKFEHYELFTGKLDWLL